MKQALYANYFFDTKLPIANYERLKTFIADQFGFDKAFINVLRSKDGHVCYPLYQDKNNNYIVFCVKDYTYYCINGELQLLSKEG